MVASPATGWRVVIVPERPGTMRAVRGTSAASEKRIMINELDLRMSGAEVDRRG